MAEKIIIASGKGGSGKTSLCTGLAMALRKNGSFVLVVDCDIAQGCIDFMLSAENKSLYTWGDIINESCVFEDAVCSGEGVDYLTAPKEWNDAFTSEAFGELIASLENKYSYILFDSPAGITGGFTLAASCADRGIVVSTPDEVCVKAAARATDELYALGVEEVKLVINRFDKESTQKGKYLNIDETIDSVAAQLIGVVPEDKAIAYASSTGFVSLKDCPAKAAYERIAIRVAGGYVKLTINNKKKNSRKKEKKPNQNNIVKKAISAFFKIVFALIIIFCCVVAIDIYNANRLREPYFEIPTLTVESESKKIFTGICYTYEVGYDENGAVVSTKMEIDSRVVALAAKGKGMEILK